MSLSDKKPKYTRGGILYSSNLNRDDGKGWSNEGIERFNELFDLVRSEINAPDVQSARDALITLQTKCEHLSKPFYRFLLVSE